MGEPDHKHSLAVDLAVHSLLRSIIEDPEATSTNEEISASGRLNYAAIARILLVGVCAGGCGSSGSSTSSTVTATTAREVPNLTREGFQEGVRELFQNGSGGAISVGIVFSSPQGASQYFSAEVNPERLRNDELALEHVTVPGVRGAVISGGGPNGNVSFTTGRCFVWSEITRA